MTDEETEDEWNARVERLLKELREDGSAAYWASHLPDDIPPLPERAAQRRTRQKLLRLLQKIEATLTDETVLAVPWEDQVDALDTARHIRALVHRLQGLDPGPLTLPPGPSADDWKNWAAWLLWREFERWHGPHGVSIDPRTGELTGDFGRWVKARVTGAGLSDELLPEDDHESFYKLLGKHRRPNE